MKKNLLIIVLCILTLQLCACTAGSILPNQPQAEKKIRIVATIFPLYDWARQILGDEVGQAELTLLLSSKLDLHNYQPSVDDIVKISTCDLFIYVGGESDKWVNDALKTANPHMITLNLLEVLGTEAKVEEVIAGMEMEEEADSGAPALDEHVWLSLKNAGIFCAAISGALSSLDPDNSAEYQNNMSAYAKKLSLLDESYRAVVDASSVKTLLFGDRFPFRYIMDDYGLAYYAAFAGCSAETEASFDTVVFLANMVDKLNLRSVMVTESSDQAIAKTIISNTAAKNQQIFVLDAMQSVTANEMQNGATYLSIMESNLTILKEALK